MSADRRSIADLQALVGKELGVSGWHDVGQARVSEFAAVTEDFQFIHVDPDRAADTPFGGTVAHGFLVVSLLSVMFYEALGQIDDAAMSTNYGFDSLRFLTPVRTGSRIRGRFVLDEFSERKPGQWKLSLKTTVEIENQERPALVADWVVLFFGKA